MTRYHINVKTGDDNVTNTYYFVHKQWADISPEESDKAFDNAVHELDYIYKTYGRFATSVGVIRLFDKFGFENTISN